MNYSIILTKVNDRYFFDIVNTFKRKDNDVAIIHTTVSQWLDKYGQYISYIEGMNYGPHPRKDDILVTDSLQIINDYSFRKNIYIDYNYYGKPQIVPARIKPYGMHPNIYKLKQHIAPPNFKKKYEIAFVGNVVKEAYTNSIINNIFNMPNRYELFEFLKKLPNLTKNEITVNKIPKNGASLLLVDKNVEKIEDNKWLDFVSKCKYFIALPGVTMPMCHNLIECIYCGVIPIIHKNQNVIGLEHEKNALIYDSMENLEEIIYDILDYVYNDSYEIMKSNVFEFYREKLDYGKFMEELNVLANRENFISVMVNAEQTSVKLM